MSDAQMIVEIANEYRRLQRQLESKQQQVEALLAVNGEAGPFPTDFEGAQVRRYAIEFPFVPGTLVPQERSVTVESGTIFRCAYMESFLKATGTAADPYTAVSATSSVVLPWDQRLAYFDYMWRVRDTGTDREWVDPPQPSLFGGGGYVGPAWLPRRVILGGGSVIYATVDPFISAASPGEHSFFTGGTLTQYVLQMDFVGHEIPDLSAL